MDEMHKEIHVTLRMCVGETMKTLIALVTLTASLCWGQNSPKASLQFGAVDFGLSVKNSFEFILMAGLYLPNHPQLPGGFNWGGGKFHLYRDGLGSGQCAAVCQFDGTTGRQTVKVLDQYCTQISFPVLGRLKVGSVVQRNANGLYSQTFCDVGGSLFMAGGSLIVYGKGY